MHRVAPLLLLSGVVLLVSWVVAPAAPSPTPLVAPDVTTTSDQMSPVLSDVAAEVNRLKNRLETPPSAPEPHRDPFRFGPRPEPVRPTTSASAVSDVAAPPPAPSLPKLLAIVDNTTDSGVIETAVFSIGDDLQVVKAGDAIGKFVVQKIGADAVELVDTSGATFRIPLR